MIGDQLQEMLARAQNDPAQLAKLAASGLDPQQVLAKLRALGAQMAQGTPQPQPGVGGMLAAPAAPQPVAQPGQPVPPQQAGIGHLLLGG